MERHARVEKTSHPLKKLLNDTGIQQSWLAARLGLRQATFARYLNGDRPMPNHVAAAAERILKANAVHVLSHGHEFPDGNDDTQGGKAG